VANDKKWAIKAIEVASDHVHLLVEYDPHHSIAQVIKAFQGKTGSISQKRISRAVKTSQSLDSFLYV
jgi:putative transposase